MNNKSTDTTAGLTTRVDSHDETNSDKGNGENSDAETFDGFTITELKELGALVGRIELLFSEREIENPGLEEKVASFVRLATGREANPQ